MAVKVTDILRQILTDQGRRTIDGEAAIVKMLEKVRRQVLQELVSVPPADGSFPAWRLRQTLDSINHHLAGFESEAKKELAVAITESWEAGAGMLGQMVVTGGGTFGISSTLLTQMDPWQQNMKNFTWGKIEGLAADAGTKIKAELSLGVLGQKTPYEVAQAIAGNLPKELPKWKNSERTIFSTIEERAQVITQTEMGRAFSMAHQGSMAAAADTLPELQKMWLHAGHPKRARIYHLALNGSIKPVAENFLVGNIAMMHPRDPKAPASEVIRCGCMHVAYMAEWGTKEQFLKSWEKAQASANRRPDSSKKTEQKAVNKPVQTPVQKAENKIRNLKYEKAVVLNSDGSVFAQQSGTKTRVEFSAEEAKGFKGKVFTHNHPTGGTFSKDDVKFAVQQGLKEMRAVSATHDYSIAPPAGGWNKQWWQDTGANQYAAARHETKTYLKSELAAGRMTRDQINNMDTQHHELWTRFADKTGAVYTKQEIGQ